MVASAVGRAWTLLVIFSLSLNQCLRPLGYCATHSNKNFTAASNNGGYKFVKGSSQSECCSNLSLVLLLAVIVAQQWRTCLIGNQEVMGLNHSSCQAFSFYHLLYLLSSSSLNRSLVQVQLYFFTWKKTSFKSTESAKKI